VNRGFGWGVFAGLIVLGLAGYFLYLPEIENLIDGMLYLLGLDRGGPSSY
jgi:hypothetical protein